MEEILAEIRSLSNKFVEMRQDIDTLKAADSQKEPPSPRSRTSLEPRTSGVSSKRGSTPQDRSRSPAPKCRHWADRDDLPDYSGKDIIFPTEDDEEPEEGRKLVEVSEHTSTFLTDCCKQSLPNNVRLEVRRNFPLPKVAATRTPQMDPVLKAELSSSTKSADRELARIQSFVLDALAPLSALIEADAQGKALSQAEGMSAVITAAQLIGNTSAHISNLRREKAAAQVNKTLTPLVKDEDNFIEAAPLLFGKDCSKEQRIH